MQKRWLLIFLVSFFFSQNVFAVDLFPLFLPKTGDKTLDSMLDKINDKAKSDINTFIKSMSTLGKVHEASLRLLLDRDKFAPGDIYMAVRLSVLSGKPFDFVVTQYKANRGQGWGVMAKRLGIKPGSRAFHELKNEAKNMAGGSKGKGKVKKGGKRNKGKGKGKNK
ncbi:MAG: hypothetical protein OEV42_18010 [Deltaproteobacteria bacterium]|nr:hypothetical protein [Deltaproteobacteria bacterium]